MHHFCQFSVAAGGQNGDFQTFLDFEKTRALWDLENNSVKALFGQNMKKLKILKLSPDFRFLQKLALKIYKKNSRAFAKLKIGFKQFLNAFQIGIKTGEKQF